MKTRTVSLIIIFFFILTVVGCREEVPELSWTGYNSVEAVHYNIHHLSRHNRKEFLAAHSGDTLKVYGYINFDMGPGNYYYGLHTMTISKELAHTNNGSWLFSNPFVDIIIPVRRSELLIYTDTLAYVTGVVSLDDIVDEIVLDVVEIKSNPGDNEEK